MPKDRDNTQPWIIYIIPSLLAFTSIHRIGGGDVWWHIRLGESLLSGRWPPHPDLYSYTATGPLTYVEPIADILIFFANDFGGDAGLIALKALVLFALGLCLLWSLQKEEILCPRFCPAYGSN